MHVEVLKLLARVEVKKICNLPAIIFLIGSLLRLSAVHAYGMSSRGAIVAQIALRSC